MKLTLKLILAFCILLLLQVQFAQILFERGKVLCLLQNLPHRGLGLLYAAHLMQPHREDYAESYLGEYLICKKREGLSEPQRIPVMAMWAATMAREFPDDATMQTLLKLAKEDVRKQLEAK